MKNTEQHRLSLETKKGIVDNQDHFPFSQSFPLHGRNNGAKCVLRGISPQIQTNHWAYPIACNIEIPPKPMQFAPALCSALVHRVVSVMITGTGVFSLNVLWTQLE